MRFGRSLEGGIEVEKIGFSADDAQFLQSRNFSVEDIARFFRVPPHMIGSPTRLAYASSETEYNSFLTLTLAPWLTVADVRAAENLPFIPGTDQLPAAQTKGNLNAAA